MLNQLLQNPLLFRQQLNDFARQFQNGANPQQLVQQLLNSGKMSQAQFNQFRDIANQLTGMHN